MTEDDDRFAVANPCERCGDPMPEDCIGWCASCNDDGGPDDGPDDGFYAWGGWRRAFGDYSDAEWAARARCRFAAPEPEEIETMRHALGASTPSAALGFRNYYCVSAGSSGEKLLKRMVHRGFMRRGVSINGGRDTYYHVVVEWVKRLVPQPEAEQHG